MDSSRKEKWDTWWWYHKNHVLITIAALAIVVYSVLPGLLSPKTDYSVAVITTQWLSEETLNLIREHILQIVGDVNGDGQKVVDLYYYRADLSGETEGTVNYSEAARLDADLVGKISSIIILDNPEGFRRNTAVSIEPEILCETLSLFEGIPLPEGTAFTVRSDSEALCVYQQVAESR